MAKVTITIEDSPSGQGIIFAMVSEPPLSTGATPPTQAQLVAAGLVNGLMASAAGPSPTPSTASP